MYTERLTLLLKGNARAFKHYSELENHVLMVARDEIKALYDKGFIDEYFDYYPFYDKENQKGGAPKHITFKRGYRQKETEDSEHQNEIHLWHQGGCRRQPRTAIAFRRRRWIAPTGCYTRKATSRLAKWVANPWKWLDTWWLPSMGSSETTIARKQKTASRYLLRVVNLQFLYLSLSYLIIFRILKSRG